MVKMCFTNNQTAFEYALYEIATSYFKGSVCTGADKDREKRMAVHFREQKVNKQCLMEDTCIRFMNDLKKKIPAKLLNKEVTVKFRSEPNGFTRIFFLVGKIVLQFDCTYSGADSKIQCIFWKKEAKTPARLPQAA